MQVDLQRKALRSHLEAPALVAMLADRKNSFLDAKFRGRSDCPSAVPVGCAGREKHQTERMFRVCRIACRAAFPTCRALLKPMRRM